MKLGTIEEEAALCRAAFKDSKVGDMAWCVHHEILCEPLTEPAEARIQHILTDKPVREQVRRLHEMRPVRGDLPAELDAASAELDAASAELDAASAEAASAEWNAASAKWYAARAELDAARAKLDAARAKYKSVLEVLHAAECPDSAWNGTTIFPAEEEKR